MSNEFVITGNRSLVSNNKKSTTYTTQNNVTNFMVETNQIYEEAEMPDYENYEEKEENTIVTSEEGQSDSSKFISGNISFFSSSSSDSRKKIDMKSKSTIWSAWYGGSAKHTKDHLGNIFSNKWTKTTFDEHDRMISYKNGKMYVGGVLKEKDENGIENITDKNLTVKIKEKVTGWGDKVTNGKLSEASANLKSKIQGIDNEHGVKVGGLDQKLANSKWGKAFTKYNAEKLAKYGRDDIPGVGSTNQYRVGQNWSMGSVALAGNSGSWEGNLIGLSGKIGNEKNYIVGEFDVGHAETTGGWELGPDHFVLSGSAEASLIHAEIGGNSTWYESDYQKWGASGTVKGDVAKAYINGKFGAGYYKGIDNRMHLDLGVQGSIGADLCSATASGVADLGLASIGGTATVKIGIGAQANIGIEDGKLNLHLGVALGVGVELGVSIDVSKGFNLATDFMSDVYEDVFDVSVEETWNNIQTGAEEVWDFFTGWL